VGETRLADLRSAVGRDLQWTRPHVFSSAYELRTSDSVFALYRSTFWTYGAAVADGVSADGPWRLSTRGFWHPSYVIQFGVDAADGPVFEYTHRRKSVYLGPGGREYEFKQDFWGRESWISCDASEPLLTLRQSGSWLAPTLALTMNAAARGFSDLTALAILTLHLKLARDAAAAAV